MRAMLMSFLEINSNKLRLFHQNQGTLRKHEALTEKKKLCLERGLVEKSCVDCIRDVFSPLPVKCACHRNQKRHPTSLRLTSRVHRHPSH